MKARITRLSVPIAITMVILSGAGGACDRKPGVLDPSKCYRGAAFLASSIDKDISSAEILGFVRACRMNFVVIDFAWITFHWGKTDLGAVERLTVKLKKAGVEVAVMYRPRVLRASEGEVHYAVNEDGTVADHHIHLCYAHEDSVVWGMQWGMRILSKIPLTDKIILYNLLTPCHCRQCRNGRGRIHATKFLERCRYEWKRIRPAVQIGHVGLGAEYIEKLDFYCPFLSVNRWDDSPFDPEPAIAALLRLKSKHLDKPMIPLMKLCWGSATRNTTEDITRTLAQSRRSRIGFLIWYYGWVFRSSGGRYDRKAIVEAMGGERERVSRYFLDDRVSIGQEMSQVDGG